MALALGSAGAARAAALLGAVLGAVMLSPAAARAQGADVGLVVHAPAGSPATVDAVRAALTRTATRAGVRLEERPFARAAALLAGGSVRAERLEGFARVERLAGEGWRGYLEARFGDAAAALEQARVEAAGLLDLDGGPEVYAEVCLRLGAVELTLGREREAELDLRLAARLDPKRTVSDAEFKPAVVERHRRAAGPRARLRRRIDVDPAGAALEVDGRPAGSAPAGVDLEEGRHVVVARAAGRAARAEVVLVDSSGAAIQLRLDRDPLAATIASGAAGLRIGLGAAAAGEVAQALIGAGELDGILVVASVWRLGQPALLGQYCGGAPLVCGRPVEIGHGARDGLDRAAAALWRTVRAAETDADPAPGLTLLGDARLVRREAGPDPRGVGRGDQGGRWWQSRWLWVGVGGAALSAAAAGFLIGVGGDDERQWSPSIGRCEFGGC
ncbi:MAG TPA: hypothetical protein VK698_32900 [Kofleriaceae bacterium]|nr:hypothetical protein [Kofleriaceae bacterium]